MMAKMFYTLDETKVSLGLNEEEIKQLSREGRLREFRDGPRLMFKADQVDNLRAELAGGGEPLSLGAPGSGGALGRAGSPTSPPPGPRGSPARTLFRKFPPAWTGEEDTAV